MHNIQINTERLLLRPLKIADAEDVFEWVSDEKVWATFCWVWRISEIGRKHTNAFNGI